MYSKDFMELTLSQFVAEIYDDFNVWLISSSETSSRNIIIYI